MSGAADAARRALREAREREARAQQVRERDASATRPPEDEAAPSAAPGDDAKDATAPDGPVRQEARPGDVAREALRAARRARTDTEEYTSGDGPERTGPAPAPAPARLPAGRGPRGQGRAQAKAGRIQALTRTRDQPRTQDRVRHVRELLAGALRTPPAGGQEISVSEAEEHVPAPPPAAAEPAGTPPAESAHTPPADPPAPASPRVPASMAAPARDGDLRRTFPAFPRSPSGTTAFAETWWGNAWVKALEEGALDAARLGRGRTYAREGHVDAITVTPGLVLGYVQGSRARPYRTQVRLRTLSDADWERFLDAAAERPGHIAALLDKEMPHTLAECGVRLLPGADDLVPSCSCPDHGHPCKHAAALCYQTARLLDEDPFVLLLLRGRGERELLDALSRRSAARAARAAQDQGPAPLPGVRARDALAARPLPPLPAPLPPLPHPGQPPAHPGAPGGPDPFALDQLATDAAARAHALLTTGHDPIADLTLWLDAVRLAAARPGSGLTATTRALYSSLASATGRTPADLARAVAAWRQGGPDGLAVLEEPWDPPAGRFDRARPLLRAADLPAFRPWRNRLTHPHGHVQLRLGRDGLWYPYESEPDRDDWWPRGTPDPDPVGALMGLGAIDDL